MRLPYVAFVLAAMACAVAHAAILVSVVRSRSAVRDSNVPRPRLLVEIIWAVRIGTAATTEAARRYA